MFKISSMFGLVDTFENTGKTKLLFHSPLYTYTFLVVFVISAYVFVVIVLQNSREAVSLLEEKFVKKSTGSQKWKINTRVIKFSKKEAMNQLGWRKELVFCLIKIYRNEHRLQPLSLIILLVTLFNCSSKFSNVSTNLDTNLNIWTFFFNMNKIHFSIYFLITLSLTHFVYILNFFNPFVF